MKIHRTGIALGAALLLGLTACGGGDTTAAESATPAATSPATTEAATTNTDEGCTVLERTGSTKNKKLQAFADAQYESIDCSSDTDLADQLTALTQSAEYKKQVADQGWDSKNPVEAMGAVSVTVRDLDSLSFCMLTVLDEPVRGKTLSCQDA